MIKKIFVIFFMFLSLSNAQEHFVLEIDETGESTLFIFLNSISTLAIDDEIGIFDANGIVNDQGNTGEILVGTGTWTGSQLEVVAIQAVDLSDFGGPILPGASSGNSMILKGWSTGNQIEYDIDYITDQSGVFNGLFSAISLLSCPSDLDTCGVCYGLGNIYECGCYDIPDGECDCEENILDCDDVCY